MNISTSLFRVGLLLPIFLIFSSCGNNPVAPEEFTGSAGGCGNFSIYKFNPNQTNAVVVKGTAEELVFNRTPRRFTLPDASLNVRIDQFSKSATSYYCDDVMETNEAKVTDVWEAVSGTLWLASGDTITADPFMPIYQINVSLKNVEFRNDDGELITIDSLDYGMISVGWLPG